MAYQKVKETKWFQHLDEQQLGQVVKLEGIEDDGEMILFHFSDGTKCNTEFVAPLNDKNAFKNRNVMAEVSDPNNVWTFKDVVVVPENKKGIDRDGNEWMIPDPYYDPKGQNGPNIKKTVKEGIPPKSVTKSQKTSKLAKFGFEIEEEQESAKEKAIFDFDENQGSLEVKDLENIQEMKIAQPIPQTPGYIPLAPITGGYWSVDINKIPEICFIDKDILEIKSTKDILYPKTENAQSQESSSIESSLDKNDPIYILLDKCKKKEGSCNLNLKMQLPGKSIFNLIEEEYEKEDKEKFFDFIISQLNIQDLKDALKSSLRAAYEAKPEE